MNVNVGDRLEDPQGDVWTVAEVFSDAPHPCYSVVLIRLKPVVTWADVDEIGERGRRYRPVRGDAE